MELNSLIACRFRVVEKLGFGSFGEIYLGVDVGSKIEVAIKVESLNARFPQLIYESRLIRHLWGISGLPEVLWYGSERRHNIMVMTLLGLSLEEIFCYCNRRFSLKTILMLGNQMLSLIQSVHERFFLHRDIKPDNFLLDKHPKSKMLYIIDFGLAKRYRDTRTLQHIEYKDGKSLTGTARYASLNSHLGIEQSRRDDLESIGYVLMYFLRGNLPWQGLTSPDRNDKYKLIKECKIQTSIENLIRGFPEQLAEYFTYVKQLRFEEDPDVGYLQQIFNKIMQIEKLKDDQIYDWHLLSYGLRRSDELKPPTQIRQASRPRKQLKELSGRKRKKQLIKSEGDINSNGKSKCTIF